MTHPILVPTLVVPTLVIPTLVITGLLLSACAQPARQRPHASAASTAACRAEVNRVYNAQNRVDLSTRDTRDTPFASNYLSGITTRGLGAEYSRDNMVQSCLNNASSSGSLAPATPVPAEGATFTTTPTAR